jgi:hypothetical protein
MIIDSVRRALVTVGVRKMGTPLLTASARERLEEQPHPARFGRGGQRRRRAYGLRMAARHDRLDAADGDDRRERRDEQVRGQQERDPRLARAAQVHDREHEEDRKAERDGVRQERRCRRHERADAGRDADGDVQDVVERERRTGEQRGPLAEVLLGDCVRASAVRVRADRLQVREKHDEQEHDDRRADRHDVREAERAERQEQRERRLRAVGGRRQRVEAEDGHARERADLLLVFFARREATAEDEVRQGACCLVGPPTLDHGDRRPVGVDAHRAARSGLVELVLLDHRASLRQSTNGTTVMPTKSVYARIDG